MDAALHPTRSAVWMDEESKGEEGSMDEETKGDTGATGEETKRADREDAPLDCKDHGKLSPARSTSSCLDWGSQGGSQASCHAESGGEDSEPEPEANPDVIVISSGDASVVASEQTELILSPLLEATSLRETLPIQAGRRFKKARWPHLIVPLGNQYNPFDLRLPLAPHFGDCNCVVECRDDTCHNAKLYVFCTPACCSYQRLHGTCGNGIREFDGLRLVRVVGSTHMSVIATRFVPSGVAIGQYLGLLQREKRLTEKEMAASAGTNGGYKLVMRDPAVRSRKWVISIDARRYGSMMRFVNHSCSPAATFRQVYNGRHHTVVVVTTRSVQPGEEITVDYGKHLWFRCHCGQDDCCHAHLDDSTPVVL